MIVPFDRPCPAWSPRLPSMTVDVRQWLDDLVRSPSATMEARFSAAESLGEDEWRKAARDWEWLFTWLHERKA